MLKTLIKSAVRRKIIGLFATNLGYRMYARQVAMEIRESPHAVGLELAHLVGGNILTVEKNGKQVLYKWNGEYPYSGMLREIVNKMREDKDEEIMSLPDLARREKIAAVLKTVVDDIKKYYNPEKIILFGSAATGSISQYSDIDLVVVKKTSLPYFERVRQLVDLLNYNIDIDLLIYTPEEFKEASKERDFFKKEIIRKGKVLYDKAA